MTKIGIDYEYLSDKDVVKLTRLIDLMPSHTDIVVYKLSKDNTKAVNVAEVKSSLLPYSKIEFVTFDDYSNRIEHKHEAMSQHIDSTVFFTKDYDLAMMLSLDGAGVFLV